ncbi:hypothetical protein [Burkholderia pseudomallei]|uniref:hypothetical protein n=1 Tax=Burkholderia pseudomallei TaxID=28450 RepID=UPI0012699DEC|nr:hypothetical protein [Burkholderia pseudomallei]
MSPLIMLDVQWLTRGFFHIPRDLHFPAIFDSRLAVVALSGQHRAEARILRELYPRCVQLVHPRRRWILLVNGSVFDLSPLQPDRIVIDRPLCPWQNTVCMNSICDKEKTTRGGNERKIDGALALQAGGFGDCDEVRGKGTDRAARPSRGALRERCARLGN